MPSVSVWGANVLLALLLAQVCSFEGEVCAGYVKAPVVAAQQFEGLPNNPVNLISKRHSTDPGADLVLLTPDKASGNDSNLIEARRAGVLVYRVGHDGEVIGTGAGVASFIAEYGGEGHPSLMCRKASGPLGGCNVLVQADMDPDNQSAEHGWLTIDNLRRYADGGYPLQVMGTGRGLGRTVALMDVYGNLALLGGMVRPYVPLAARQACEPGAPRDGVLRGAGMTGYVADGVDALQLCTPLSGADGGYETVCTDRNGACSVAAQLATLEARIAALEAQ